MPTPPPAPAGAGGKPSWASLAPIDTDLVLPPGPWQPWCQGVRHPTDSAVLAIEQTGPWLLLGVQATF